MMIKIEKILSISEKVKNGKPKEISRVQDLNDKDIGQLDKSKFKKSTSQRDEPRLESKCFVILKDDFEDYERGIDSKIQSLEEDIQDKDKTIKQLQDDLSAIDEDYQKKIENIKRENNAKMDELKEALHDKDLEIERTKTRYEKEIGVFREEIQKEINALELYDEDKHMKIKDHDDEVKGIKDKIVRETIINNDRINELEKGLTITGFIRGKYKTPLQDLKEGIEHFQYIAQYSETYENQVFDVKDKEDK